MKFPLIQTFLIGSLVVAIAILIVVNRPEMETGSTMNSNATTTVTNAPLNTSSSDSIIRPPYPKDEDGCTVVDLRSTPPTSHDPVGKQYAWIVEHPPADDCVRQYLPRISENVTDSLNEKIQGTNNWRYTLSYE